MLRLFGALGLFGGNRLEVFGSNGVGANVSTRVIISDARSIAEALRSKLILALRDDDRILVRGTITKDPDDGTMHLDPEERRENYSTSRRVLFRLADFRDASEGFDIV